MLIFDCQSTNRKSRLCRGIWIRTMNRTRASKIPFIPRRVFPRLLVILLSLTCVPLLVSGVLMMRTSGRAVRGAVLRTHQEIVLRAAREVGLFVESPTRVLRLATHMVGETWDDPWKVQTVLIQMCLEAPILERVYFLDAEGREITSSDLKHVPIPPEGERVFEETMRTRMLYRSDVSIHAEPYTEAPSMMLGVPVFRRGRVVGALVARVNLRNMWTLVDRIRVGEHSIAYVISAEGVFLAHTDRKNVINERRPSEKELAMIRSDVGGSMEFQDETGRWLASYARVLEPELGWYAVLQQPTEEAYHSSAVMRRTLLLTLVVVVITGSAIVGLTTRTIVRPVKTLVEGTHLIARRDWDVKIPVRRGDEIGELADAFEHMASELKRHSEERDRALRDLQQRSEELARANRMLETQQRELKKANVELRKVDRLKTEFLSNVSHELRTPLTSMRIYLDYMAGGRGTDGLSAFQTNALASIRESTNRLGSLVEDLLNLSRMETSALDLQIEESDLYEIVDLAIQELRARAERKEVRIDVEFAPGDIRLEVDRRKLMQVLSNLVGNGVKFTEPGGTVSVRADYEDASVRLRVTDTGIGIPSHEQEKIFERFYQVGQGWSASETSEGAGLGLAIVKKVVEAHGGTVGVESVLGEGATFIVVLPRVRA